METPVAASVVQAMFEAALAAQQHAYAPYSHYRVGAAMLTPSGTIYAGCNVENAAYPQGACAEAGAIAAMCMGGEQEIIAALTVCDGEELGTCCGGCRQRIREFASSSDIPIYAADGNGIRETFTLEGLLPHSFGPEHVQ